MWRSALDIWNLMCQLLGWMMPDDFTGEGQPEAPYAGRTPLCTGD